MENASMHRNTSRREQRAILEDCLRRGHKRLNELEAIAEDGQRAGATIKQRRLAESAKAEMLVIGIDLKQAASVLARCKNSQRADEAALSAIAETFRR